MKFPIALMLTCYSMFGFSQNFAPLGAKWHYGVGYMMPGEGFISFESIYDTIVATKNCRVVQQSSSIYCSNRPMNVAVYEEDSVVYYWDEHRQVFQTLYDFTKQEGESWQLVLTNSFSQDLDTIDVLVTNRSVTQMNQFFLQTLEVLYTVRGQFEWSYQSFIHERIGDFGFLYNHQSATVICDDGFSHGLRCYEDSAFGFYTTNAAKPCDFNSLDVGELSRMDIKVFPNPSTDIIRIDSPSEIRAISICDATGKVLFFFSDLEMDFDISFLEEGIYFVRVETQQMMTYVSFVKE